MHGRARIDAIDFWRGFALLTIFADHMPFSVLAQVTYRNFGLSDAAEAFVFLSGMSAALAYGAAVFRWASCVGPACNISATAHDLCGPNSSLVCSAGYSDISYFPGR